MAYDPGAIDATLAAAVGDEPGLIAELRLAFVESAERAYTLMAEAETPDNWKAAAWRLKGLAASFGAIRLMALATDAVGVAPREPAMLAKLKRAIERL